MKKILSLLLMLSLLLVSTGALGATLVNGSEQTQTINLNSISPFKFEHHKKGIGFGVCPVYSAPSMNAYRAANGKASVDTNSNIDVGGFNDQGWLLVRYSTNKNGTRVGWIPAKYIKNFKTSMTPHFTYIRQIASAQTYVTDNNLDPHDSTGIFAKLEAGEEYYVVGRYNYYGTELLYIEFDLNGQQARGFILAN